MDLREDAQISAYLPRTSLRAPLENQLREMGVLSQNGAEAACHLGHLYDFFTLPDGTEWAVENTELQVARELAQQPLPAEVPPTQDAEPAQEHVVPVPNLDEGDPHASESDEDELAYLRLW